MGAMEKFTHAYITSTAAAVAEFLSVFKERACFFSFIHIVHIVTNLVLIKYACMIQNTSMHKYILEIPFFCICKKE